MEEIVGWKFCKYFPRKIGQLFRSRPPCVVATPLEEADGTPSECASYLGPLAAQVSIVPRTSKELKKQLGKVKNGRNWAWIFRHSLAVLDLLSYSRADLFEIGTNNDIHLHRRRYLRPLNEDVVNSSDLGAPS